MENENVLKARELIYNSPIIKYVSIKDIEEQLSNIYIFDTEEEFLKEYGGECIGGGIPKGFNRSNKNYFNPKYISPHVIIHEILHGLSSEFDKFGHRTINGIQGLTKTDFGVFVNEGLTDYLASKISNEPQRHYLQGQWLFGGIEESLIKEYNDSNILYEIYLNNRVDILESFLNRYGGKGTFEDIYNNFLIYDKEKMSELASKINKKFERTTRKKEILDAIKKLFKLNKTKRLSENNKIIESNEENSIQTPQNKFKEEVKVEDYEYPKIRKISEINRGINKYR